MSQCNQEFTDTLCWDLVDNLPDGLCCTDTEGVILYANKGFATMTGGQTDALVGVSLHQLVPDQYVEVLRSFLSAPEETKNSIQIRLKEGNRWTQLSWIILAEHSRSMILVRDLSWHKAKEEELLNQALTDDLTGLYNRRGFRIMAEQELRHSFRLGTSVVLLSIDIDTFKQINDTLGHPEGDKILKGVAATLKQSFRSSDIIGRWGGDEFLVLALDAPEGSVAIMSERFKKNVADRFRQLGKSYIIGVTVGSSSGVNKSLDQLIKESDTSMYANKKKPSQQIT